MDPYDLAGTYLAVSGCGSQADNGLGLTRASRRWVAVVRSLSIPLLDRCLDSSHDEVVVNVMLVPRIMHCAGSLPEMDTHLTQHRVAVADPRSVERVTLPANSWSATPRAWFVCPHGDVVVEASTPPAGGCSPGCYRRQA